ncbi:MAG: FMN-binding protein [Bacteroidales bacterium]|nr:FMN-binding protein [Bacteroidales bacterium]
MKKTFSNTYIFVYSAVLVVVAALILTVVSVSLKPSQEKNQQAETKQMILKTIGIDATRDNADELYAQNIKESSLNGNDYFTFPGGVIIPLKGTGLWGPIWGYLAFDDGGSVKGAVFDHKGETPGLGGEISSDKFASRFIGKQMCEEPIHLKKNADKDNPYEVDAISGGTMTSNGVTAMLATAYEKYSDVIPCYEDCEAISALMMEEEEQ